jgi:hypothetical protein
MFKNRFILIVGLLSIVLVTMAVSRPSGSTPIVAREGSNDFYQRHSNGNRTLAATDYYARHPELRLSAGSIADLAGDFSLRHPEWTISVQNATIPMTGILEASDYFQRYSAQQAPLAAVELTDYFARHPELSVLTPSTDLSDYFLRH